jgi:transcription termination/antitermination protein NusA
MKLDNQSIQLLNMFESITHSSVKDCIIEDNRIIFIVNPGHISKAIGQKGKNVQTMEYMLKKKVKIVEFNEDPLKFIKNFLMPIRISTIEMNQETIEIKAENNSEKGILIGRDRKNLNDLKEIVNKYFSIVDIKII